MKLTRIILAGVVVLLGCGIGYIALMEVPVEQEQTRTQIPLENVIQGTSE